MIISREVDDDFRALMMAEAMDQYGLRVVSIYPYRDREMLRGPFSGERSPLKTLVVVGQLEGKPIDKNVCNKIDAEYERMTATDR